MASCSESDVYVADWPNDGTLLEFQPAQRRPGQEIVQAGCPARCLKPIEIPRCDNDDSVAAVHCHALRLPRYGCPATASRTTSLSLAFASPSFQAAEREGLGRR